MVIDDSISVRRVTTNLLRSSGWDVLTAKDGVDALEVLAAAETPPEVFLCDMEMPRMDGIELIGRIRNQAEFRTTPIVMVTSRAGEKHRKLAADAGADEHVVKPFNDEQLIGLITQLVASARESIGV
jgi:chemosensory pili system protein ChpA (sensor histidine kinase/response regulator)